MEPLPWSIARRPANPLRNGYLPDAASANRLADDQITLWACVDLQRNAEQIINQHASLRNRQAMALHLIAMRLRCSCSDSCIEALRMSTESMLAEVHHRHSEGLAEDATLPDVYAERREVAASASAEAKAALSLCRRFLEPLCDDRIQREIVHDF
jgi:hypothetical protein